MTVTVAGTANPDPPLLEVKDLRKVFVSGLGAKRKSVVAVDGVDMHVSEGEAVSLVGESGSGKSTVARLVARLFAPTSGKILLAGRDVLAEEPRRASRVYRHQVQMIFQDPFSSLNPVHTIRHHLLRAARVHGTSQGSGEEYVNQLLASVGLGSVPGVAGRFPHELSGGQRQRVAIARSLAARPALLVADEPTSMLDVSVRVGILNLLDELRAVRRIGLVLITHDLASARYATSRTYVMYAGTIVEHGFTRELIEDPRHPYTRLLVSCIPNRGGPGQLPSAALGATAKAVPQRKGCPFAPRCSHRSPVCDEVMPAVSFLDEGRSVRCHLYAGSGASGMAAPVKPAGAGPGPAAGPAPAANLRTTGR